ncbi:unnamed protein product [Amoebophrya sp. A120]|nr:unnamed protein product [Amoebophrya sp. A120]|eukprot:GSA120T00003477001.1
MPAASGHQPIDLTRSQETIALQNAHLLLSYHYQDDVSKVLASNGMIQDRIEKLAMDIRNQYNPDEELHLMCVLKGSRGFFTTLLKYLTRMACYSSSSQAPFLEHYARILQPGAEGSKSESEVIARLGDNHSHEITIVSENLACVRDKHVLVCEDLINTGKTLALFCAKLREYGPKSLRIATLLEKRQSSDVPLKADFCGFTLPSTEFVVGYSLDHQEKYRDLTHLCALKPQVVLKT